MKKINKMPKELIKPSGVDSFYTTEIVEFMCRENDDATTCRVNYNVDSQDDILF